MKKGPKGQIGQEIPKGPKGVQGRKGPRGQKGAKCSPEQIVRVRDILHSMDTPSEVGMHFEAKKRLHSSGFLLFCATLFFVMGAVTYLFSERGVVEAWIPVPFFLVSIGFCVYSSYRKYF